MSNRLQNSPDNGRNESDTTIGMDNSSHHYNTYGAATSTNMISPSRARTNSYNTGILNESNHSYLSASKTNGEAGALLPPRAPTTNTSNAAMNNSAMTNSPMLKRRPSFGSESSATATSFGKLYPWAFHNLNVLPPAHEPPALAAHPSSTELNAGSGDKPPISMVQVPQPEEAAPSSMPHEMIYYWVSPPAPPITYLVEAPVNGYSREYQQPDGTKKRRRKKFKRSWRRRLFLILTEPDSSMVSAMFFAVLITVIFLSNIIMMMETMNWFQYTPDTCDICGNNNDTLNNDDTYIFYSNSTEFQHDLPPGVHCVCAPISTPGIVRLEDFIMYFFSVEWILRVLCYEPSSQLHPNPTFCTKFQLWLQYLIEPTTIIDALATFPYYMERYERINGLISLRLLRLFRTFQIVRLGQYNFHFICLINVLRESLLTINLLLMVLLFGAAIFGSTIYWFEKGQWEYTTATDPPSFTYVRLGIDGVTKEPTPFTSIPASFWWFIVTATTVGYGDVYPTSTGGKIIACVAMLTGVLVIAFPVSIFSDLWSKQLKDHKKEPFATKEDGDSLPSGTNNPMEAIQHYLEVMEDSHMEIKRLLEQMQQSPNTMQ